MPYRQRDVVMVKVLLPDGAEKEHPFIIITCRAANNKEQFYTGIMITATKHRDMFTFPVDDSMFEGRLEKPDCTARLYVLSSFREASILRWMTRMKKLPFTAMLNEFKNFTLSVDNE